MKKIDVVARYYMDIYSKENGMHPDQLCFSCSPIIHCIYLNHKTALAGKQT